MKTIKRSSIHTQVADRKSRRKEERKAKKQKVGNSHSKYETQANRLVIKEHSFDDLKDFRDKEPIELAKNKEKKKDPKEAKSMTIKSSKMAKDNALNYDAFDPNVSAAMRADDEEIDMLEKNLGITKGSKEKRKLNKEYAKLEGYGDDFGDFLDTLDDMLSNISGKGKSYNYNVDDLEYDSDESDPATARAKYLLRMETLNEGNVKCESDSEDDGEEIIPMKDPSDGRNEELDYEDDEVDDYHESTRSGERDSRDESDTDEEGSEYESENSDYGDDDLEKWSNNDLEFSETHTYRPVAGQDLYGNVIDHGVSNGEKLTKYIPPHMRNKSELQQSTVIVDDNDPSRQENLRTIQRLLNNSLNRLSDNMLESVSKSIASMYKSSEFSSRDINDKLMKNMNANCVAPHMIMSSLIPVYIACISAVYIQVPDSVKFGSFIIEKLVLDLMKELKKCRNASDTSMQLNDNMEKVRSSKEAPNLMLMLCYFYNYNVINCRLMYDLVRDLITSFTEMDIELLLLNLSHCGSQLRSDDPSALKDIVSMVQERSMKVIKSHTTNSETKHFNTPSSSRAQFMITAITDLKNNKRSHHDLALHEKTSNYRKILGRIKSQYSSTLTSDSLKIPLQDILDAEVKGRWWIVGGTWVGKQQAAEEQSNIQEKRSFKNETTTMSAKEQKLLKLAMKQRMNTDLRRSIFCIIMGSDDYEDAFEKLVRSEMLRGKSEREVVRVLVHCCGTEKSYNPYYFYLAKRICDYQNNCKFTFQLSYWDCFKQFLDMKSRKAANLAKLLAELLKEHVLNINVLKVIDISPNDMPESAVIFLSVLFSNIFDSFPDPNSVVDLFKRGEPNIKHVQKHSKQLDDDNLIENSGREVLKQNIQLFLIHYLQSSPKNVKNSTFRKNLKAAIKACEIDSLDYMM